jgi:hypothetical protein
MKTLFASVLIAGPIALGVGLAVTNHHQPPPPPVPVTHTNTDQNVPPGKAWVLV